MKHHNWLKPAIFFGFTLAFFLAKEASGEAQNPCKGVQIETPRPFSFSLTELELFCNDKGSVPWRDIPNSQKILFLRSFLQKRGFFYPEFKEIGDARKLFVKAGPLAKIDEIKLIGNIDDLDMSRYWQIKGQELTPPILDGLEKWVVHQYNRSGYPCATAVSTAYPETGLVELEIKAGEKALIEDIQSQGLVDMRKDVERRYDAFKIGEVYDSLKLDLTNSRLAQDELVLNSSFKPECLETGVRLQQSLLGGAPRLVSLGVGFDTEEYAIAEGTWKNARLSKGRFQCFAYAASLLFNPKCDK